MTGGERGSPRNAPGKRGGGRGEALTQVRGHSGGYVIPFRVSTRGQYSRGAVEYGLLFMHIAY